jgi:hypothetical protein
MAVIYFRLFRSMRLIVTYSYESVNETLHLYLKNEGIHGKPISQRRSISMMKHSVERDVYHLLFHSCIRLSFCFRLLLRCVLLQLRLRL